MDYVDWKYVDCRFIMEVEKTLIGEDLFYEFKSEIKPNSKDLGCYTSVRAIKVDEISNVCEILKVVEDTVKLNIDVFSIASGYEGIRPRIFDFHLDLKYSTR